MQSNLSRASDTLQLWFARVGDNSRDIEQAIQPLLCATETKRLQATSNPNKRREYLLSRALIRHALTQHFGTVTGHWEFIEQPGQAPTIFNLPNNIYFSLSHSKGTICFALATCPIGIDLEKLNTKRNFLELAKAVMNEEEIAQFEQQPENQSENFYRHWCAKEAYYKMLSAQQQSEIALKDISVPELQKNNDKTILMSKQNAEFMLAVVVQENPEQITCHAFPSNHPRMSELAESFN